MTKLTLFVLVFIVNLLPLIARAQPAELMIAARGGDAEKVQALLASGAEVDPPGIATPLYFAAQSGHLEISKMLLEAGADPSALSQWGTPLHIAARRGHVEIVRALLDQGSDSNAKGGDYLNTPMQDAAIKGDVEVGKLLLKFGADVNARNRWFQPPIHFAAKKNRAEFVEFLKEAGAAPVQVGLISEFLGDADIEKGRIRALECGNCHLVDRDALRAGDIPQVAGPLLWGVLGRPIASLEGFPYSDAMRAQEGTWSFERLNGFLADPAGTVPGTAMLAGHVPDEAERIALIAYLRTMSDDPVPLP